MCHYITLHLFLFAANLARSTTNIQIVAVNKETATKRYTLLHAQRQLRMVAVPERN